MKLVRHIVRKDLARLRWWLVAWLGVLLLPVLFGFDLLVRGPLPGNDGSMDRINSALLGLEGLMVYVLTILLIQEDAIVGTRQFWLTRPITNGQLLAAKALGAVAIFGAMPVLVSVPWWWWCGFGPREMAIAALESCALAALVAIPAALVAVLTDSLARALLWTVVLIAAIPVAVEFFTGSARAAMTPADFPGLAVSRTVLAVAAVAVEFLLVVVAQYYLRQRGRWLVLAAIAVVSTLASASAWPWSIVRRNEPREINPERARGVNVQFGVAEPGHWGPAIGGQTELRSRTLDVGFIVSGVGSGENLSGVGADQQWRGLHGDAASRGPLYSNYFGFSSVAGLHPAGHDEETRRWWNERIRQIEQSGRHVWFLSRPDWPDGEFALGAPASLWASQVDRIRHESSSYKARLWLELVRLDIALEAPLKAGRWHSRGGRGMRIESVTPVANGTEMRMVETHPGFLSNFVRSHATDGRWFRETALSKDSEWIGVALNRTRNEFVPLSNQSVKKLIVNGVQINWRDRVRLSAPRQVRGGKWEPIAGWMDGVMIGVVTMHSEATFARDKQVPHFVVTERSAVGSR